MQKFFYKFSTFVCFTELKICHIKILKHFRKHCVETVITYLYGYAEEKRKSSQILTGRMQMIM